MNFQTFNIDVHDINIDIHDINVDIHDIYVDIHDISIDIHDVNIDIHDINIDIHTKQSLCFRPEWHTVKITLWRTLTKKKMDEEKIVFSRRALHQTPMNSLPNTMLKVISRTRTALQR